MTKEEKRLLLKDLCARLPYKVIVKSVGENKIIGLWDLRDIDNLPLPYLRPMDSMTEEEREELKDICTMCNDEPNSTYEYFGIEIFHISRYGTNFESDYTAIDWLNSHHFDYRGLIPKRLALPATEGMYKI